MRVLKLLVKDVDGLVKDQSDLPRAHPCFGWRRGPTIRTDELISFAFFFHVLAPRHTWHVDSTSKNIC